MKKLLAYSFTFAFALSVVARTFAVAPGAVVKNTHANPNACWGMDRAYYAGMKYFPSNMDIKQSFSGDLDEQLHSWIDTYCEPHGPVSE